VVQGARSWSYGYDSKGRLAWSRDPLQRTDSLYYDDADRLIRQVLPNGSEIFYGYDANGNLTSLTPRPAQK
jgi:YD repeat-containing protein